MLDLAEMYDLDDEQATAVDGLGTVTMERDDQEIDYDHLALDDVAEEALEDVE